MMTWVCGEFLPGKSTWSGWLVGAGHRGGCRCTRVIVSALVLLRCGAFVAAAEAIATQSAFPKARGSTPLSGRYGE